MTGARNKKTEKEAADGKTAECHGQGGSTASLSVMDAAQPKTDAEYYCPKCDAPVSDPLVCGDCASIICRRCGTSLERIDDLGIG